MSDATTDGGDGGRALPDNAALLARLPGASSWDLTVTAAAMRSPSMRRLTFEAPNLGDLVHEPGQDLMFTIPTAGGGGVRRRYTIRSLGQAAGRLDVDVVLHGDGPGARWAASVAVGASVEAIGPRGKVLVDPEASWHLFAGDDSAVPVTAAMVEALAPGSAAIVLLEVGTAAEEQPIDAPDGVDLSVRWVHRGEAEPGRSDGLATALAGVALPAGHGHAYLNGELRTVNGLRKDLVARGLAPDRISMKAYWRLGAANAAHGEPAHD